MPTPKGLVLSVPDTELSVTIDLLEEQNPESADLLWSLMPLQSIVGHVVVSGGGLWIPTRAVYTGPRRAVKRTRGSVYFYPPMQSICITYGEIRESSVVNECARVRAEDLPTLARIGKHVWDTTVISPRKRPQRVSLDRLADQPGGAA